MSITFFLFLKLFPCNEVLNTSSEKYLYVNFKAVLVVFLIDWMNRMNQLNRINRIGCINQMILINQLNRLNQMS